MEKYMLLKYASKTLLLITLTVLSSNNFAQVNFFECAKNPAKCKPHEGINESARSDIKPVVNSQAVDSQKIEHEIRKKLDLEFEKKMIEEAKRKEELEKSDQIRLEAELRKKITFELDQNNKNKVEVQTIDTSIRIPLQANKKALVIGNDSYLHVSKLFNARADANEMGRSLSNLGYSVIIKNDLNEKEMKAAIRQLKNSVVGGDEVIFFYAGHGVQIGVANYLLPVDIKGDSEDQVRDEAIQLQKLLDDMHEMKAKFTLALIDACRDNPFPKSGRAIGGRGLAATSAASGQMIIFSAGSGQQAMDKLGPDDKDPNGLFTRTLLKEMYAPGVRVDNVVREVRKKVVSAAKSVGHEQVPAIYDQVVGDFYFIPPKN